MLQRIQQKLSTTSSTGGSQALLRDDIFNLICLLGSPLFTRLVELDTSLSRLSDLSHQLISLKPDDFDFDPRTGDLIVAPHPYRADEDDDDDDVKCPVPSDKTAGGLDSIEELLKQGSRSRKVELVELYKAPGGSLGFGVVGLRSDLRGELGIFVQEIQPGGLADRYSTYIRLTVFIAEIMLLV